jgi:putative spermidine/putrescine transport system ATP-binding protein/spermidine/putrescine transport system ATP-binding protein
VNAVPDIDVELAGVSKSYGTVRAVRDVSLAIPRGVFFSLLGPSGCGKTTTLRLIAGFELASEGDVFIRGRKVTGTPPYRRDFSMVFQNFALFPHLTVAENVAFGLRMRRIASAERAGRVAEALRLVKLDGFEGRYPKQLSGGQQQRVALARAIIVRPAVLLLDEPLGALDKSLREAMQVELRQLQKTLGITAVFVTHDQEEALTMSDEVAVMRDGVIEQLGPPRTLYERPATEFVAGFLGASNFFDARVIGREGSVAIAELGPARLPVESDLAIGAKIRLAVRPEKIQLAPSSDASALPARIREIVYRGATTHLYLDSSCGSVVAYLQNTAPDAAPFAVGDDLACRWAKGSAVVLGAAG